MIDPTITGAPKQDGFRMPAEWALHERSWMIPGRAMRVPVFWLMTRAPGLVENRN